MSEGSAVSTTVSKTADRLLCPDDNFTQPDFHLKQKSPDNFGGCQGQTSLPARDCRTKRFQAEFDENQTMEKL
jgi:hypothetical protein